MHAYFVERGEQCRNGLVVGFLRARKARLINTGVYVPENGKTLPVFEDQNSWAAAGRTQLVNILADKLIYERIKITIHVLQ